MAVASCCWMLRVVMAYVPRLGHRESICTSQDMSERAAECWFVLSKASKRKMRTLLSDGNGQQLHVVGAVATISARLGHRESICTSSAMCWRAVESVSAASGSLAAVAAHLLLCPLSPLFQAARPSWASRRLRDPVFLFRVVSYSIPRRSGLCVYGRSGREKKCLLVLWRSQVCNE